ncbi:hypothetical protein T4E_3298 [Trichinella pseudospiralis]|uniref:Uncharacterized protein n=1 Tax=Trichinella pseudospiralis TaxID=6337 RepID=A0A0V0XGZ8_TRIPS|nr:hypothetical protein T4E_3298 [Trichinella pseudospiralis]
MISEDTLVKLLSSYTRASASAPDSEPDYVTSNRVGTGLSPVSIHCSATVWTSGVLLPVVRAIAYGENGRKRLVNCLLDSGSERSLIRTDIANELRLWGTPSSMAVRGVHGLSSGSDISAKSNTNPRLDQIQCVLPGPLQRIDSLRRRQTHRPGDHLWVDPLWSEGPRRSGRLEFPLAGSMRGDSGENLPVDAGSMPGNVERTLIERVLTDMYVDDLATSYDDNGKAHNLVKTLSDVM